MRISDWSSDVCSSDLNEIAHNKTANIIVSSYFSTGFDTQRGRSAAYDPYPQNIYVANNRFAGGGNDPTDRSSRRLALAGGNWPTGGGKGLLIPKSPVPAFGCRMGTGSRPNSVARPRSRARRSAPPNEGPKPGGPTP